MSVTVDDPLAMPAGSPAPGPRAAGRAGADASGRGQRGIAVSGRPASVPSMPPDPKWHTPDDPDMRYVPDEASIEDVRQINTLINQARARLHRIGAALIEADQARASAEAHYERRMRRALLAVSGGTAETRRAMAELACEDAEDDMLVARQVVAACKIRALDCRKDLDALETMAHNLRKQMDLM